MQCKISNPDEDNELKEITIKGTYKYYIFGNKVDYFKGYFSVEGVNYSFEKTVMNLPSWESKYLSALWYVDWIVPSDMMESDVLGEIISTKYFKNFLVFISEPANSETVLVICAPATPPGRRPK